MIVELVTLPKYLLRLDFRFIIFDRIEKRKIKILFSSYSFVVFYLKNFFFQ